MSIDWRALDGRLSALRVRVEATGVVLDVGPDRPANDGARSPEDRARWRALSAELDELSRALAAASGRDAVEAGDALVERVERLCARFDAEVARLVADAREPLSEGPLLTILPCDDSARCAEWVDGLGIAYEAWAARRGARVRRYEVRCSSYEPWALPALDLRLRCVLLDLDDPDAHLLARTEVGLHRALDDEGDAPVEARVMAFGGRSELERRLPAGALRREAVRPMNAGSSRRAPTAMQVTYVPNELTAHSEFARSQIMNYGPALAALLTRTLEAIRRGATPSWEGVDDLVDVDRARTYARLPRAWVHDHRLGCALVEPEAAPQEALDRLVAAGLRRDLDRVLGGRFRAP